MTSTRGQSNPDGEEEELQNHSQVEHARYKQLEKQVAEIVRDPRGQLKMEELSAAEKDKFLQLVHQMAEIRHAAERAAALTSAAASASHDGVADVASSTVFAVLTEGEAATNGVLDLALRRFRQNSRAQ